MLDAHRKPDQIGGDARLGELLVIHLAMGRARGMKDAGAQVRDMGRDGGELQRVHEAAGRVTACLLYTSDAADE